LIYYEAYTEREDAEGREKFLKSGAGRRFLRTQLRHYLRVKRLHLAQLRLGNHDVPLISHVSERFYVALARWDPRIRGVGGSDESAAAARALRKGCGPMTMRY
jgi:hypothetical protein